ncbi:MAG: NAD(P)H-dependent oxidoreductase [Vampirovibrionales bacterium]|nr:NAD(P)H-dependent oxidoreductase [Vampirovibrionales bacterium]
MPSILTILGHPLADSYGAALAEAYTQGAQAAGARVTILRLGELAFDARRHPHRPPSEGLEGDLATAREAMARADFWRIVFPVWSGTYPALMKAFFDCALGEDFAFERDAASGRLRPLLRGKTAGLIATMNTPPWLYRWALADCGLSALRRCALGVCGVKTLDTTRIGPIRTLSDAARGRWLARVEALGRADAHRLAKNV